MKKKTNKATPKKKCDELFSLIIRTKGYCEWCRRSNLQFNAHHIVGRTTHILRWDIRNGCNLCIACHFKAHNSPLEFAEWFKSTRPEDYEYLKTKTNSIAHYSILDYEDILVRLKEVSK